MKNAKTHKDVVFHFVKLRAFFVELSDTKI